MKFEIMAVFIISLVKLQRCSLCEADTLDQTGTVRIEDQKVDIESLFKGLENCIGQITKIILNNVSLKYIPEDAFRNLSNLEVIDLSRNELVSLASSVFTGLGRVRSLRLSHNCLVLLHSDLLRPLLSLTSLDVSNNKISVLSDLHLPPSTSYIDFSYNNISNKYNNLFSRSSTFQVNYADILYKTNSSSFSGSKSFKSKGRFKKKKTLTDLVQMNFSDIRFVISFC